MARKKYQNALIDIYLRQSSNYSDQTYLNVIMTLILTHMCIFKFRKTLKNNTTIICVFISIRYDIYFGLWIVNILLGVFLIDICCSMRCALLRVQFTALMNKLKRFIHLVLRGLLYTKQALNQWSAHNIRQISPPMIKLKANVRGKSFSCNVELMQAVERWSAEVG